MKDLLRRCVPHGDYVGWHRERFGVPSTLVSYAGLLARGGSLAAVRPPGMAFDVFVRPGTSDLPVFDDVFLRRCYDVPLAEPPGLIIDAGANTGLTAAFFADRYPDATVVAIELERDNYAVLQRNARPYPRIRPLRAALWNRDTSLHIENPTGAAWSFRVREVETTAPSDFPAVGVHDVLRMFPSPRIDLLKMDIEGSEIEVLGSAALWMDKVDTLVVELHDRFRPGCQAALETAVAGHAFTRSTLGDCIVLTRERPGSRPAPAPALSGR